MGKGAAAYRGAYVRIQRARTRGLAAAVSAGPPSPVSRRVSTTAGWARRVRSSHTRRRTCKFAWPLRKRRVERAVARCAMSIRPSARSSRDFPSRRAVHRRVWVRVSPGRGGPPARGRVGSCTCVFLRADTSSRPHRRRVSGPGQATGTSGSVLILSSPCVPAPRPAPAALVSQCLVSVSPLQPRSLVCAPHFLPDCPEIAAVSDMPIASTTPDALDLPFSNG